MTIDTLRELHRAKPFTPFVLHLADGRDVRVGHSGMMLLPPGSPRTVVVATPSGGIRLIDVLLIVEASKDGPRGRRRRAG